MRPSDAVSYIFLMLRELEPLAEDAGETALSEKLRAARIAAAEALARLGQSGG